MDQVAVVIVVADDAVAVVPIAPSSSIGRGWGSTRTKKRNQQNNEASQKKRTMMFSVLVGLHTRAFSVVFPRLTVA